MLYHHTNFTYYFAIENFDLPFVRQPQYLLTNLIFVKSTHQVLLIKKVDFINGHSVEQIRVSGC